MNFTKFNIKILSNLLWNIAYVFTYFPREGELVQNVPKWTGLPNFDCMGLNIYFLTFTVTMLLKLKFGYN